MTKTFGKDFPTQSFGAGDSADHKRRQPQRRQPHSVTRVSAAAEFGREGKNGALTTVYAGHGLIHFAVIEIINTFYHFLKVAGVAM